MCGRYTLRRIDLLRSALDAVPTLPFEEFTERPHYNVAPSQDIPMVYVDENGRRVVSLARWGLIPAWAKEAPKIRPINARAETVATSGMFRAALERRRCLIPADGFYEWQAPPSGKGRKQPFFIHFKDDRPFAFAGLWEHSQSFGDTCTIITTEPNDLMRPIHNRMPVILRREDYAQWLCPQTPGRGVVPLLHPYDGKEMEAYPISDKVNRPANDGAELIDNIDTSKQ
jgi:putative SOS response-associated peptidase YedK